MVPRDVRIAVLCTFKICSKWKLSKYNQFFHPRYKKLLIGTGLPWDHFWGAVNESKVFVCQGLLLFWCLVFSYGKPDIKIFSSCTPFSMKGNSAKTYTKSRPIPYSRRHLQDDLFIYISTNLWRRLRPLWGARDGSCVSSVLRDDSAAQGWSACHPGQACAPWGHWTHPSCRQTP